MSQENVEVLQAITAHFNETGNWEPRSSTTRRSPSRCVVMSADRQTYTGHQGLVDAMASFREAWAEINPHILRLIEGEDVVIADIRFELRSHAGVQLQVEEAWASWFQDGRVKHVEQHGKVTSALEAAGLSE